MPTRVLMLPRPFKLPHVPKSPPHPLGLKQATDILSTQLMRGSVESNAPAPELRWKWMEVKAKTCSLNRQNSMCSLVNVPEKVSFLKMFGSMLQDVVISQPFETHSHI